MKYLLNIQSFSSIITNSSSEIFTIVSANDSIKQMIQEIFDTFLKEGKWNYSGETRGLEMWTLKDYYGEIYTLYEEYNSNYEEILNEFGEHIYWEDDYATIYTEELSFEQYVKLRRLIDEVDYCSDALFLQFDYGNSEFKHALEDLGINLIDVT